MDKIEIRDLEIFANHGVFPEETALGQKFVVSAVLKIAKDGSLFHPMLKTFLEQKKSLN